MTTLLEPTTDTGVITRQDGPVIRVTSDVAQLETVMVNLFFVGPRDAGVIIDGDVNELPADALAAAMAAATAGDAMADCIETPEFLDVEMDDLAGRCALVARTWLLRFER